MGMSDKRNDDEDWCSAKKPTLNINCIYRGQQTNAKKKCPHHSKMDPIVDAFRLIRGAKSELHVI